MPNTSINREFHALRFFGTSGCEETLFFAWKWAKPDFFLRGRGPIQIFFFCVNVPLDPDQTQTPVTMYDSMQKDGHRDFLVRTAKRIPGTLLYTEGPDAGCTRYLIDHGVSPHRLRPVNDEKKHPFACDTIEDLTGVHCLRMNITDAVVMFNRCAFIWLDLECTTVEDEVVKACHHHLCEGGCLAITLSVRGIANGFMGQEDNMRRRFRSCGMKVLQLSGYEGRSGHCLDMVHGIAEKPAQEKRLQFKVPGELEKARTPRQQMDDIPPNPPVVLKKKRETDFDGQVIRLLGEHTEPVVMAKREEALKEPYTKYVLYNATGTRLVPHCTELHCSEDLHRHGFLCRMATETEKRGFSPSGRITSEPTRKEKRDIQAMEAVPPPVKKRCIRANRFQPRLIYTAWVKAKMEQEGKALVGDMASSDFWVVSRPWNRSKDTYVARALVLSPTGVTFRAESRWTPSGELVEECTLMDLRKTALQSLSARVSHSDVFATVKRFLKLNSQIHDAFKDHAKLVYNLIYWMDPKMLLEHNGLTDEAERAMLLVKGTAHTAHMSQA